MASNKGEKYRNTTHLLQVELTSHPTTPIPHAKKTWLWNAAKEVGVKEKQMRRTGWVEQHTHIDYCVFGIKQRIDLPTTFLLNKEKLPE